MTANEGALSHTVHGRLSNGGAPRAGDARAPARPILASVTDLTDRSRRQVAERWGKPIEEPSADVEVGPEKTRFRDGFKAFHLWADARPSQRSIAHDYRQGLERTRDEWGLLGVVLYRLFGWPQRGACWLLDVLRAPCERTGRFAGLVLILILFAIALAIAGAI